MTRHAGGPRSLLQVKEKAESPGKQVIFIMARMRNLRAFLISRPLRSRRRERREKFSHHQSVREGLCKDNFPLQPACSTVLQGEHKVRPYDFRTPCNGVTGILTILYMTGGHSPPCTILRGCPEIRLMLQGLQNFSYTAYPPNVGVTLCSPCII